MIIAHPKKKKKLSSIDNTLCDNSIVFEYFGGDQIVPEDIEEVRINPKVTNIKDGAFSGNKTLKKVVLHEHLREIGKSAFLNCSLLEVITLSTPPTGDEYDFDSMFGVKRIIFNEGLQEIGAEAFSGCISLQNKMVLPLSINTIGDKAFRCCYKLGAVTLNKGLQKIGEYAFHFCDRLDKLILPPTLTKISKGAFSNCDNLRLVKFSEGLEVIEQSAFSGCRSLMCSGPTNDLFTLPSTVKRIDSFAFASGSYLGEVVLNEGLRSIGFRAFTHCRRLYNVTLPSTLVDIGVDAFEGCHSLWKVTLLGNINLKSIHGISDGRQSLRFEYSDISSRLEAIIQTGFYPAVLDKIDVVKGLVERDGSELYVPAGAIRSRRPVECRNGSVVGHHIELNFINHWDTIRQSISDIIRWIEYYELKEAASLFELALWKTEMGKVGYDTTKERRYDYLIEVPDPVKHAIKQYLM